MCDKLKYVFYYHLNWKNFAVINYSVLSSEPYSDKMVDLTNRANCTMDQSAVIKNTFAQQCV